MTQFRVVVKKYFVVMDAVNGFFCLFVCLGFFFARMPSTTWMEKKPNPKLDFIIGNVFGILRI
jgi:hypothetical protein